LSIWDDLDSAQVNAESFRDELHQKDGFALTKWFDGISRYVKPAVLAIAVASGATGCSNLSVQAMDHQQTPYTQMVKQAQSLDSMPRVEVRELIESREHPAIFNELERTTVTDLAAEIASQPGLQVPLDNERALENPFVPGQLIQVARNNDVSANFTMAMNGFGLINAFRTPFNDSPHAWNSNNTEDAVSSFSEPNNPAFIVLPERMQIKWPSAPGHREEAVAFTLFHEAAHPHMLQEVVLHLNEGEDSNKIDAHLNTYKILNENHADITAAIAVFQTYPQSAEQFADKLRDFKAFHDMTTLGAGMSGAPNENFGYGMYRSQDSIDVLIEIIEKDPEFLQSLEFEEIPLLAYDVVRQAGYTHNAAELLLERRSGSIGVEMAESVYADRSLFAGMLTETFPENTILSEALDDLEVADRDLKALEAVEAYTSNLSASIMFEDMEIPEREIWNAMKYTDEHTVEGFDLPTLIESHVAIALTETNPDAFFSALRGLREDIRKAADLMPDRQDIKAAQDQALSVIRAELQELSAEAKASDPSSVVAQGSGDSSAEIAERLMKQYGIDASDLPDASEDQHAHASPGL
jgi:hypothetical protein